MWVVFNSRSTSWNPVERLIFPAPAASYDINSFPDELLLIPGEDGGKIPCIFLPFKHARFLIIYFHANAEDLGVCYSFCKIMRDLFQVHVLAVEYPGYGICPGTTTEAGIMANATAAVRFATETLKWPTDGIKLFGRSLGTGPCMALATQYDVAGVVLVSPFTSIQSLFRAQIGALADMVQDRFRSVDLAAKVMSPTLIIHGQEDKLIPIEHGKTLYDLLKTRKMMVCPANMGHNTSLLKNIGSFVLPMTQFFSLPDYTFEDIEVPPWCFPQGAATTADAPIAPAKRRFTVGEACNWGFCPPQETASLRDREKIGPDATEAEDPPLQQPRHLGDTPEPGALPQAGALPQSRPLPVPRLSNLPAPLPVKPPTGIEVMKHDADVPQMPYMSPRTDSRAKPEVTATAADLQEVSASRNYQFSGLGAQLANKRASGGMPLSARLPKHPTSPTSHYRGEILDAVEDTSSWRHRLTDKTACLPLRPEVPMTARGAIDRGTAALGPC